jgi:hypothetical protein
MKRQAIQIIQVVLVLLGILQLGYASEEFLGGANGWAIFNLTGGASFLILAALLGSG